MTTNELMAFYGQVFDLLVRIGGAPESQRDDFIYRHVRDRYPCHEYRFQGKLGFGGKYRSRTNKVDCYPEDENDLRKSIIFQLNNELRKLKHEADQGHTPET